MDEERSRTTLEACAEQLSAAAGALERALEKLSAQYESLNQKVDRIIASVESEELSAAGDAELRDRVEELERENVALSAQAQRAGRKTLPSMVSSLLAKGALEGESLDASSLEKALQVLSVEQRIAVKAE